MSAAVWIVIGVVILAALGGEKSRKVSGKTGNFESGQAARIDHPHYFSENESECSICGARFPGKEKVCPCCGARFVSAREDDLEFMEEMELLDGDDRC